jgi:hypothetical protein
VYRASPIGVALTSVLAELKEFQMVTEDQLDLLKDQFNQSMMMFPHADPEGTFAIQQGSTVIFRWVNDYFDCTLQPAVIEFIDGSYTSPSL